MPDQVRVRALTNHTETADPGVETRLAGEVYHTTLGLARRRERAGLVERAPMSSPETEEAVQEDVQEAKEAEQAGEESEEDDLQPPTTRAATPELETKAGD